MMFRTRFRATVLARVFIFLALLVCAFACGMIRRGPPNVLLITIDALRGDHLELRGYSRETAPELSELASRGVYFKNAVAQAPLTIPSLLMIMTGKLFYNDSIPDDMKTVAEILKSRGYATAAFVRNPLIELDHRGIDRGFDTFYCPEKSSGSWTTEAEFKALAEAQLYAHDLRAEELLRQAEGWLEKSPAGQPFFLWVHLFDPHDPYYPPSPYDAHFDQDYEGTVDGDVRRTYESENPIWGKVEKNPPPDDMKHIIALYDGEIRYTSAQVGAFLKNLETAGLDKRTLIVVSSDHGESLGEHNLWGHGLSVYEPETLIPLIMVLPGRIPKGKVVSQPVEAIDIVPTVLSLIGKEKDGNQFSGKDVADLMKDGTAVDERAGAFARWKDQKSYRTERWKLVDTGGKLEAFDLKEDPMEQNNIAELSPALLTNLQFELGKTEKREVKIKKTGKSLLERLESLGYLK